MSARKNFFFRQRVTEAELDSAFDDLEDADHNLAGDRGRRHAALRSGAGRRRRHLDGTTPRCVRAPRCAEVPPPRPDKRSPLRPARLLQRPRDRHCDRHAATAIIADLSEQTANADGAARIGARASGTLPAGSVRTQLDALNASAVRTNAANVFSATQTVNGTADETNAALATTSAPTVRKLLWELAGAANAYKYRLYAELHALFAPTMVADLVS